MRRRWLLQSSALLFDYKKPLLSHAPRFSRASPALASRDLSSDDRPWLRRARLHPDQLIVSKDKVTDYTRWLLVPASTLNHVCLGSVFAWSCFNQPLMRLHGVAAPAASDWGLGDVTLTFSLVMGGFVWGAVFSKKLDEWGPRVCGIIGAASVGGGYSLIALASHLHSLPVLYAGGVVWGLANGLAYMPPVAALMKWFPDRKGFASSVVVVGYGGGALIAAPAFEHLLTRFQRAPERLGSLEEVALLNKDGKLYTSEVDAREVVVATMQDLRGFENVEPGVFVVGTGSTGVVETLCLMGSTYAAIMLAAAFTFRFPPQEAVAKPDQAPPAEALRQASLRVTESTKTPQFALMWTGFMLASTGAYSLISSSKLILSSAFPGIPGVALTSFVASTSLFNLTGRMLYPNLSDSLAKAQPEDPFLGRRSTYGVMWGLAPLGYTGLISSVYLNDGVSWAEQTSVVPFGLFCASTALVLSSFGGSAATRPAIVSDLYGPADVAALSARQLSAVLPAALLGPRVVSAFAERNERRAVTELADLVSEADFQHAFGAGKHELPVLIERKTATISRVMELVPAGTSDPTPYLFNDALGTAAGLTVLAFLTNRLTRSRAATPRQS